MCNIHTWKQCPSSHIYKEEFFFFLNNEGGGTLEHVG